MNNVREIEELQGAADEILEHAQEASESETNEERSSAAELPLHPVPLRQDTPESERQFQVSDRRGVPVADTEPQLNKLIVYQLASSVPGWLTNPESVDGAVQLYSNFKPVDATESVLALLAVGLTNATIDGLERANRAELNPQVRHMELKLSHKGSAAVVDVLKMLHTHRGAGDQKISVGNVNIGSGGKAIVGNVQSAPRNEQDEER